MPQPAKGDSQHDDEAETHRDEQIESSHSKILRCDHVLNANAGAQRLPHDAAGLGRA